MHRGNMKDLTFSVTCYRRYSYEYSVGHLSMKENLENFFLLAIVTNL